MATIQQGPATLEQTLRNLRTIHGALLVSVFLYAYVVLSIPVKTSDPFDPVLMRVLVTMGVVLACVAFVVRTRFLRPAFETLRMQADDTKALTNWRKGVIVSDALAEAVVLFGVALHFSGANNPQAIPFLIAGAVLMMAWWPQRP